MIKKAVFYPAIQVKPSSYIITIDNNVRKVLQLDDKVKKLKKGETLRVKILISLLDEE